MLRTGSPPRIQGSAATAAAHAASLRRASLITTDRHGLHAPHSLTRIGRDLLDVNT